MPATDQELQAAASLRGTPVSRGASIVIAASNASDRSKAQADLVCSGTADDETIQTALDSSNKVELSEGSFGTAAPIDMSRSNVSLLGAGANATIIAPASNTFDAIRLGKRSDGSTGITTYNYIRDLGISIPNSAANAAGINVYGASRFGIEHVFIQRGADGIRMRNCDRFSLHDFHVQNFEKYGLHLLEGDSTTQADDVTIGQFRTIDLDNSTGATNRICLYFDQVFKGTLSTDPNGVTTRTLAYNTTLIAGAIAANALAGNVLTFRHGGSFTEEQIASNAAAVAGAGSIVVTVSQDNSNAGVAFTTADTYTMSSNEHNRLIFDGGRINCNDASDGVGVQTDTGIRNVSFKGVLWRYCVTDFNANQCSADRMTAAFEECDWLGLSGGSSEQGTVFSLGKSNEKVILNGVNKFDKKKYFVSVQNNSPQILIPGIVEGFNVYSGGGVYNITAGKPIIRNTGGQKIAGGAQANNGLTFNAGTASTLTDGDKVFHGLFAAPTRCTVSGNDATVLLAVTAMDATTLTIAIKKRADGTAGTCASVYWTAEYTSDTPTPPAPPNSPAVDLTNWKVTLPTSGGALNTTGNPDEVLQPALASYSSVYFLPTAANLTFWCPEDGAHTSGSSYPRCELREMTPGNNTVLYNWDYTSFATSSVLTETLIIQQYATTNAGKVIVGQIHGNTNGQPMLKIQYDTGNGGQLRAIPRTNASDASSAASITIKTNIGTNVPLTAFTLIITLTKAGLLTVQYNADAPVTIMNPVGTGWDTAGCYFKAGSYVQTNTGTGDTDGGKIAFSVITVAHT